MALWSAVRQPKDCRFDAASLPASPRTRKCSPLPTGEGSRISENRRRKLGRRAVLAHVRAPLEPPGERGKWGIIGKGPSRKTDKMSIATAGDCRRPQASFGKNDPSPNYCLNEGPTSEAMLPPALDDYFNSSLKLRTSTGPDFVLRSIRGTKSRCELDSKVLFFR